MKTIEEYGAKGGGADDTAAFQKFMNDDTSNDVVCRGITYCTDHVIVPPAVSKRIFGSGQHATIIRPLDGIINTRLFEYEKPDATLDSASYLDLYSLTLSNTPTPTNVGVWFAGKDTTPGGHQCRLRLCDVGLQGWLYGVYTAYSGFCEFGSVSSQWNYTTFHLGRDVSFAKFRNCVGLANYCTFACIDDVAPGDSVSNGLHFIQCNSVNSTGEDWYINGYQGVWWDQCSADGGTGGVAAVYLNHCTDFRWRGGWVFRGATTSPRYGVCVANGSHTGSIEGASIGDSSCNVFVDGIAGTRTRVHIIDNDFDSIDQASTHVVLGSAASSCKVLDNDFSNVTEPLKGIPGTDYNIVRDNTFVTPLGPWVNTLGPNSKFTISDNIFGAR
jgi:hypothetical protein